MSLDEKLETALKKRRINKNLRKLSTAKGLIDFTSNDYLGLARNEELSERIHHASGNLYNGSGGSRLLSGNTDLAEETEKYLAGLFESENTLIFNSGYMANLAVFSALPQRGDTILYDELSHACIKDGIRLSMAGKYRFKHNDMDDLAARLKKAVGNVFIAVESVYSMDGDQCPLDELVELANAYNAKVIIDEAHTTGVVGRNGGGLSMSRELHHEVFARIYTFGKGMGIHGAAVAGSQVFIEYLINFARPFIYTTAPAPHSFIAIRESFRYLTSHPELQDKIAGRIAQFKTEFEKIADRFVYRESFHPVQAILIPGNEQVTQASKKLSQDGFDVRPIFSPAVRTGSERIRICLHTFNSADEISSLIDSLAAL